jgi:hypothetical protein
MSRSMRDWHGEMSQAIDFCVARLGQRPSGLLMHSTMFANLRKDTRVECTEYAIDAEGYAPRAEKRRRYTFTGYPITVDDHCLLHVALVSCVYVRVENPSSYSIRFP